MGVTGVTPDADFGPRYIRPMGEHSASEIVWSINVGELTEPKGFGNNFRVINADWVNSIVQR